jgi:hypothetical protein
MSELDKMLESIKSAGPAIAEINREVEEIGRDVGSIEVALTQEKIQISAQVHLSTKDLKIDGSAATTVGLNAGSHLYMMYERSNRLGWRIFLKTDNGEKVLFSDSHRGLRLLAKPLLPMLVKKIHGEIELQKRMIQPNAETPSHPGPPHGIGR